MEDAIPIVDAPRKPPQRFRRVRIAVSVFFGALTVALCVLWARSYWRVDRLQIPTAHKLSMSSAAGIIRIDRYGKGVPVYAFPEHSEWLVHDITDFKPTFIARRPSWSWGEKGFPGKTCSFPIWFSLVICASLSLIAWRKHRFSLRAMFITATLLAIVLAWAVYAMPVPRPVERPEDPRRSHK